LSTPDCSDRAQPAAGFSPIRGCAAIASRVSSLLTEFNTTDVRPLLTACLAIGVRPPGEQGVDPARDGQARRQQRPDVGGVELGEQHALTVRRRRSSVNILLKALVSPLPG
jgi:hypothetical protein